MVSIIMGVFNCEQTLGEAVESIRAQSYTNWELIMCDDGSTDQTYNLAKRLAEQDMRIILLRNKKNYGLNITLNRCLKHSRGEYIARMDGDDICGTDRFIKQVQYMDSHPEIAIVSSWMTLFDENGKWGVSRNPKYPTPEAVVSGNPIFHAPSMIRRAALLNVQGYSVDRRMLRVEDVDLWIKLYAKGYRAYNIQEPLYSMRNDKNALSRRKYIFRVNSTFVRLKGCRMLHLKPKYYLISLKPMLYGLIPGFIRTFIRNIQYSFVFS